MSAGPRTLTGPQDGNPTGPLVLRGQALTVTGYRGLAEDGSVAYYQAEGGCIPAGMSG